MNFLTLKLYLKMSFDLIWVLKKLRLVVEPKGIELTITFESIEPFPTPAHLLVLSKFGTSPTFRTGIMSLGGVDNPVLVAAHLSKSAGCSLVISLFLANDQFNQIVRCVCFHGIMRGHLNLLYNQDSPQPTTCRAP